MGGVFCARAAGGAGPVRCPEALVGGLQPLRFRRRSPIADRRWPGRSVGAEAPPTKVALSFVATVPTKAAVSFVAALPIEALVSSEAALLTNAAASAGAAASMKATPPTRAALPTRSCRPRRTNGPARTAFEGRRTGSGGSGPDAVFPAPVREIAPIHTNPPGFTQSRLLPHCTFTAARGGCDHRRIAWRPAPAGRRRAYTAALPDSPRWRRRWPRPHNRN